MFINLSILCTSLPKIIVHANEENARFSSFSRASVATILIILVQYYSRDRMELGGQNARGR